MPGGAFSVILFMGSCFWTQSSAEENWPVSGMKNASIEIATEGQSVELKCAGRLRSALAHWDFKPCEVKIPLEEHQKKFSTCSDPDGRWKVLPFNSSSITLVMVDRADEGLYRCKQAATPYIDIHYTVHLKVLSKSTMSPDDDELPQFLDGLPKNVTVHRDSQAVFQCKVSSKTPVSIMWVWQGAAPGAFRYMDEWYAPVGRDTVGLPGGARLAKLVLSRPKSRHAGRYFCIAANTKGYSNSSAFLEVTGDDEKNWEENSYFFYFFLPVGLALVPAIMWFYYVWYRKKRLLLSTKDEQAVEMTLKYEEV